MCLERGGWVFALWSYSWSNVACIYAGEPNRTGSNKCEERFEEAVS
jgi:hypothetical protein